jgi:hypothetical protein
MAGIVLQNYWISGLCPSTEDRNRSSFWNTVFSSIHNYGWWINSRNPVFLSVTLHRQIPLDSSGHNLIIHCHGHFKSHLFQPLLILHSSPNQNTEPVGSSDTMTAADETPQSTIPEGFTLFSHPLKDFKFKQNLNLICNVSIKWLTWLPVHT